MRFAQIAFAAMFAIASLVGTAGIADAAKKKKDKPGKCGVGKFYDVKKKKCASK